MAFLALDLGVSLLVSSLELGAPLARVWTLAVLVSTHMGEDAVIPFGALGRVESLAYMYFFASCGVGNSVSGLGDSVRGWFRCSAACDGGFVTKGVHWFLSLLNECPDIDVFLDGIPSQSGGLCSRSPEEVIVVDALQLSLVVGEEHHHEGLVFGKLQCCGWQGGGNPDTKIAVPCL